MRKQNTLFAQIVNFINSQPIGSTFTVRELYNKVDERSTFWKRINVDPNYQTRWYCGRLRNRNVLTKNKRGTWTVLAHIPDFVTSSMIYSSWAVKNPIKWYAGMNTIESMTQPTIQNQNTMEVNQTPESTNVTIYKAENAEVIPVNIPAGKIHSMLATGLYFEDKEVAADFAALQTPVKSELEIELNELVERLDSFVKITNPLSTKDKFIYKWIDGKVYKTKVNVDYVCEKDEQWSLRRLLEIEAGSQLPWTVLADNILKMIEDNKYYPMTTAQAFSTNDGGSQMDKKFITVDDIRGREVYIERNYKNDWQKAIINAFKVDFVIGQDPIIVDIEIFFTKDGEIFKTEDISNFCFSKEEVQAKLNDYINSL